MGLIEFLFAEKNIEGQGFRYSDKSFYHSAFYSNHCLRSWRHFRAGFCITMSGLTVIWGLRFVSYGKMWKSRGFIISENIQKFLWNFVSWPFLIVSRLTRDRSSWELLESQMRFEDLTNCTHRDPEVLHQWLGGRERKLLQVPSNSIHHVREGLPGPIFAFTWKVTVLELMDPSLRLRKWTSAFSKHRAEFFVNRLSPRFLKKRNLSTIRRSTGSVRCLNGQPIVAYYGRSDAGRRSMSVPFASPADDSGFCLSLWISQDPSIWMAAGNPRGVMSFVTSYMWLIPGLTQGQKTNSRAVSSTVTSDVTRVDFIISEIASQQLETFLFVIDRANWQEY
jgi:hypothetical protein